MVVASVVADVFVNNAPLVEHVVGDGAALETLQLGSCGLVVKRVCPPDEESPNTYKPTLASVELLNAAPVTSSLMELKAVP
jgi:hypothetical protein